MININSEKGNCPACNVPIDWEETDKPNEFTGKCPQCDMDLIKTETSITFKPKFSK